MWEKKEQNLNSGTFSRKTWFLPISRGFSTIGKCSTCGLCFSRLAWIASCHSSIQLLLSAGSSMPLSFYPALPEWSSGWMIQRSALPVETHCQQRKIKYLDLANTDLTSQCLDLQPLVADAQLVLFAFLDWHGLPHGAEASGCCSLLEIAHSRYPIWHQLSRWVIQRSALPEETAPPTAQDTAPEPYKYIDLASLSWDF